MKSNIPVTAVESQQLAAIGYDPDSKTLAITFKNKSGTSLPYHYPCEPEMFAELQQAKSKGNFFNQNIKNNPKMPATKMVPDAEETDGAARETASV